MFISDYISRLAILILSTFLEANPMGDGGREGLIAPAV